MAELTFYTNPMSRGRIVRWMLEEVGQPYDTRLVDYGEGLKSPDYLAINPMGKVPAIVHRSHVVTECAAICAYLADAFPDAGLAPPPADRAAYYRWLFFAAGPVEAAVTNRSLGVTADAEKPQMVGYGSLAATLDALETGVAPGPFICGDQFTAADVYVGSQIMWGMMFESIDRRPAFAAYGARLAARPAYVRAGAIDDAAMAPAS